MHEKDTFKTFEGVFFVAIILAEVANMWVEYNPSPTGAKVGDCAVRAVAKALGVDWETSYILIAYNGFLMGDVMSSNNVWGSVLREHGFKRHTISNTCPDCYTVKDFCEDHPVGTYVLCTGTHAVCVEDGSYFDSWDSGEEVPSFYWAY